MYIDLQRAELVENGIRSRSVHYERFTVPLSESCYGFTEKLTEKQVQKSRTLGRTKLLHSHSLTDATMQRYIGTTYSL